MNVSIPAKFLFMKFGLYVGLILTGTTCILTNLDSGMGYFIQELLSRGVGTGEAGEARASPDFRG